jgi:beta-glucanase (GH16 family)
MLLALCGDPGESLSADPPGTEWKLTWSDEFDGDRIDPAKWDFDLGNGFYNYDAAQWIHGWGNGELQYYTNEPANAFVADGRLHIRVLKESLHGCGYTSARLKSRRRDGGPLFNQKYGRFEFRAQLPTGQGVWPALWMLPQDEPYGPWAASGEIDVLEVRGQKPNEVVGTLHYGARWPANTHQTHEHQLPDDHDVTSFHVYAVEWDPGEIRWFVDDRQYAAQSFWWSSSRTENGQGARPKDESELNPWPAPFDQPFYLLMNVAVGGNFVGSPDRTSRFPAEMQVDYVRVYSRAGGEAPRKPRGKGELPF